MCSPTVTSSGIPSSTAVSAATAASTSPPISWPAASNRPIHAGSTRYGYKGKSNWTYRAPAAIASATRPRSISIAWPTNSASDAYPRPSVPTVVKGWVKIEAAGNVTLNGYPPVSARMKEASRAAGASTGASRSTISWMWSSTSSPRSLRNETVLPVRTPLTAS